MEEKFGDLGIDPVKGTELLQLLDVNPYDLQEPVKFARIRDILRYVKDIPDYQFFIKKVTMGKQVDKVDHVWEYFSLMQQKRAMMDEAQKVEQQINTFVDFTSKKDMSNPAENETYRQLVEARSSKEKEIGRITQELELYER